MKKFITNIMVYSMVSIPFALAQTSQTVVPSDSRSALQMEFKDIRDKIKDDEYNIQKMEEQKKDTEAQLDVDKATLKKYKAQLQEDEKKADRIKEQLNLEQEE